MSELATIEYGPERTALIKRTICKGATDDELQLFIGQCKRTKLDPFARQIYAIKRWDNQERREVMGVQVSIDGLRLIAERTERYAPGPKPTFRTEDGQLVATAYVKKWVRNEWHVVDTDAFWNEYVVLKKDGKPNFIWATKPRIMLAKCAEALALRKAFPQELGGLYTDDEMGQVNIVPVVEHHETNGKHEPADEPQTLQDAMEEQLPQDNPRRAKAEECAKSWCDRFAGAMSKSHYNRIYKSADLVDHTKGMKELGFDDLVKQIELAALDAKSRIEEGEKVAV